MECVHVEFGDVVNRVVASGLAHQPHSLAVGVTGESSCILQQCADALVLLHLIIHRAFHLSGDVHKTVVWLYGYDVAVGKSDVAGELAVEYIVVYVDLAHELVVAVYLDVAERTDVVRPSCHVQGVEHGGESRQRVSARESHLTHHVYCYRACLPERKSHLAAAVACSELRFYAGVCLLHGESAHLYWSESLDGHVTVGRHC